jgi:hypothetical protein
VSDQQLLNLAAFVRARATGLIGVLRGVYLGETPRMPLAFSGNYSAQLRIRVPNRPEFR